MATVERIRNRKRARLTASRTSQRDDYWWVSTRPLHGLVFLLPMVVLFELGSIFYLHDLNQGIRTTVRAENLLRVFFENLGVLGLLVPGVTVLLVLLIWHVVVKDRWQVRPVVLLGMYLEAAAWAMPLLVLASIMAHAQAPALAALQGGGGGGTGSLLSMPWPARATISLGAGIYEELVFRLLGLALCHLVLSTILTHGLKLNDLWAKGLSIAITAVAFAFYHDVLAMGGRSISVGDWLGLLTRGELSLMMEAVRWSEVMFYIMAGVFFAAIYLWRGFGIVVGTHAAYDLAVLVFLVS